MRCAGNRLLHREQVAGRLDDGRHLALLLGGEAGVLARQDLAGIGDETGEMLGRRVRDVLRKDALLLLFGAHGEEKEGGTLGLGPPLSTGIFKLPKPRSGPFWKSG